jgi:hypothetical protein
MMMNEWVPIDHFVKTILKISCAESRDFTKGSEQEKGQEVKSNS